jgi:pimeloyl-ACP methyl ester carboxylesterase
MRPYRIVAPQPCCDRVEVITLDDAVPNPRYHDWFGRYIRLAASPFMARPLAAMDAGIDIRALLGRIQTPAWRRTKDVWLSAGNSRYLAEHIPGAQLLELPRVVVDPWVGDTELVLQAVEVFLVTIQLTAAQAAFVAQNR